METAGAMTGQWKGTVIKMMGMGFGLGGFGMIIFWVVILAAIVYFVKYLVNQDKHQPEKSNAVEILKRRYASGEISEKEFEHLRQELKRT
jgi:putative membrane protein